MLRTRRFAAVLASLWVLLLIAADLLLVTRGEAVSRIVRDEIRSGLGGGIDFSRARLTSGGVVEIERLAFAPGGRRVASADLARIEMDLIRGRPLSVLLPRLEVELDPDRIADLEAWTPAAPGGDGAALPVILIDEGLLTIRHPDLLAPGASVVFRIHDGEIVQREGAPLRAYFGLRHELLGAWTLQWTSGRDGFEARLATERLVFTPKLRALASDRVTAHVDKIRPEGPAAVEVKLTSRQGEGVDAVVTVRPAGMSLSYAAFPYRFDACLGEMEFYPDGVLIKHLRGRTEGGEVFLSGRVEGYEYEGAFHMEVGVTSMAVDDRLRAACSPALLRWLDTFELEGAIGLRGNLLKARGEAEEIRTPLRVDFQDCSIRYRGFPYPLRGVRGTMFADLPSVTIDRLTALAGDARVHGFGEVQIGPGDRLGLDIRLDAEALALDATLRAALKEGAGDVFDSFEPSGPVDVRWRLRQSPGDPLRHEFSGRLRGVSAKYSEVPLPLTGLRGIVAGDLRESGIRIDWSSIEGRYEETEVRLSGSYFQAGERKELDLEARAVGLPISQPVLSAMPRPVRLAATKSKLQGRANVRTTFRDSVRGGVSDPRFTAELSLTRSAFELAVPIRDIEGTIYLAGSTQPATGDLAVLGRLDFSTARVQGKRVGNLTSSLSLNRNRFTLTNLLGTVYDGVLRGRLDADLDTGDFRASLHVAGAELREFRQDTAGYQHKDLSGRMHLEIPDLLGNFGSLESFTGAGRATIHEARLWSVPLFLKVLSLDLSRWGRSSTFEAGVIKFDVGEGRIALRSVIFRSEEASLVGEGILDFDWNLNLMLKVETEPLGDFWLFKPINVLINLFSNTFWGVEVVGPFDDPQVGAKLFPRAPK